MPYFSTMQDEMTWPSMRMRVQYLLRFSQKISQVERAPLMENQFLKTVGSRLPKCQGGAAELSTMVLGDGNELIALTADLFCSF